MQAVFLDAATVDAGDIDWRALEAQLPALTRHAASPAESVARRVAPCRVVLTNKVRLDRQMLAGAPGLALVLVAATGTDNVDLEAARERGIVVCNVRDYCTTSVMQHVFALILALTRRLAEYRAAVDAGRWQAHDRFCLLDYPMRDLAGLKLGIVGHGTLGAAVAGAASAFGLEVLVAARPGGPARQDRVPFDEVLRSADIVSLHCPLTPTTRGMIDAAALATMKNDALLINTARGALVDPAALVDALRDGRLGGAGIDVLDEEPPANGNPLLQPGIDNLIVTPHVAWASVAARQRCVDELARNVEGYVAGSPRNRVA